MPICTRLQFDGTGLSCDRIRSWDRAEAMTATVPGVFRRGKLELIEEPQGLREGRVTVTIGEEPEPQSEVTTIDRRSFLRLPLAERRRIIKEQADKFAAHYETDEWRD